MKEEWRDIKGYEGRYQVSSFGRIYSCYSGICLKIHTREDGYTRVSLYKNNRYKSFLVHRLVAEAFISNPNNYTQVNHKDENKQNNRVENLEWCTARYNTNYGTHNKRVSDSLKGKSISEETKKKISLSVSGSKNGFYGKHHTEESRRKMSNTRKGKSPNNRRKVQCITTGRKFTSIKEASEYYLLDKSQIGHISSCCRGKLKYAGKHPVTKEFLKWKYLDE